MLRPISTIERRKKRSNRLVNTRKNKLSTYASSKATKIGFLYMLRLISTIERRKKRSNRLVNTRKNKLSTYASSKATDFIWETIYLKI